MKTDDKGKEADVKRPASKLTLPRTPTSESLRRLYGDDEEAAKPQVYVENPDGTLSPLGPSSQRVEVEIDQASDSSGDDVDPPNYRPHLSPEVVTDLVKDELGRQGIEMPNWFYQSVMNYATGAAAFAGSFAIGALVAACAAGNPAVAAALFSVVAGGLHASVGGAIGGMIREHYDAARPGLDSKDFDAYTDALVDYVEGAVSGDQALQEKARLTMNTIVIGAWQRHGKPEGLEHINEHASTPEEVAALNNQLKSHLIDHATIVKVGGTAFLLDELPFMWFTFAYTCAGANAVHLLTNVAKSATEWTLHETYKFAFQNWASHLAFGVTIGGPLTAVTQNMARYARYGDSLPVPSGGVDSSARRQAKLNVLGQRLAGYRALKAKIETDLSDLKGSPAEENYRRALAALDQAIGKDESLIKSLAVAVNTSRRQRDTARVDTMLNGMFSPASPASRNAVTKMIGNILAVGAFYAPRMVAQAGTNLQYAKEVIAAQQSGQAVSDAVVSAAYAQNATMAVHLVGASWYTRMGVQTLTKVTWGAVRGIHHGLWGAAPPADSVVTAVPSTAKVEELPDDQDPPRIPPGDDDSGQQRFGDDDDAPQIQEQTLPTPLGEFHVVESQQEAPDEQPGFDESVDDTMKRTQQTLLDAIQDVLPDQVEAVQQIFNGSEARVSDAEVFDDLVIVEKT